MDQFLNDGNPDNPENLVIPNSIDLKNDIKIIDKDVWEFFLSRYGGGPEIKKGYFKEYSGYYSDKKVEVLFRQVRF
jgi:hypothetical protein